MHGLAKVRGTVRELQTWRDSSLAQWANVTLVQASLLDKPSLVEAFLGCEAVLHTASPFIKASEVHDVKAQLLMPAVDGTTNAKN